MGGGTPPENIAYTYGGRMGGRPLPKLSPANSNLHRGPKPLHIDSKPREYRSQPLWGYHPSWNKGFLKDLLRKNMKNHIYIYMYMNLAQKWATEISPRFFWIIRPCWIQFFRPNSWFIRKNQGSKIKKIMIYGGYPPYRRTVICSCNRGWNFWRYSVSRGGANKVYIKFRHSIHQV